MFRISRLCLWVLLLTIVIVVSAWNGLALAQAGGPKPPGAEHLLGTDHLGRDVLKWTVSAASYSLYQVILGLLGACAIGISLSCLSALTYQGFGDSIIIGVAETLRSFPSVLLVLLFVVMGAPPAGALAGIFWMAFWRVLRVQLYQEMNKGYYLSALSIGLSPGQALVIHVLPNVLGRNISLVVSIMAEMITAECALEFLGLGPPLDVPSLGRQVFWAIDYAFDYAWTWLPASFAIIIGVAILQFMAKIISTKNFFGGGQFFLRRLAK